MIKTKSIIGAILVFLLSFQASAFAENTPKKAAGWQVLTPLEGVHIAPPDPQLKPRYCWTTFFGAPRLADIKREHPELLNDRLVTIVPVPYDGAVSYGTGARFGYRGVAAASTQFRRFNPDYARGAGTYQSTVPSEGRDLFAYLQIAETDPMTCSPFNIPTAIKQMKAGFDERLAEGGRLLVIGGDHTISYPLLYSENKVFGKLAVIHFDAHYDTFLSYFGEDVTHGTPFRNAFEEGLIDANHSVHVGIRGPVGSKEDVVRDAKMGFRTISKREINDVNLASIIKRIRGIVGDMPVHISVDIDVLDPSAAPSTGTPSPGGLHSDQLKELLLGLDGMNIVGGDVVEVSSDSGKDITSIAAADISFQLLTIMTSKAPVRGK